MAIFLDGVQKGIKHAQLVTIILYRIIFVERFVSPTINISCRMIIDGGEILIKFNDKHERRAQPRF